MKIIPVLKSIFVSFLFVGFIAACGFVLFVSLPGLSGKGIRTNFTVYIIKTGSMYPAIPTGSLVVTQKILTQDLRTGDVIAFIHPGDPEKVIVHRIVGLDTRNNSLAFQTKGDSNPSLDYWKVYPPGVLGRVYFAAPYLGYFSVWAKSYVGFSILIGIPSGVVVFFLMEYIKSGFDELELRKKMRAAHQSNELIHGVVALVLLFSTFALFSTSAYALYTPQAIVNGIGLRTAVSFLPSPRPSLSPSPTPSMPPIPTATPIVSISPFPSFFPSGFPFPSFSGFPCPSGFIGNCGNGAGSVNGVNVTHSSSTSVTQSTTGSQSTTVVNDNSSGGNTHSSTTIQNMQNSSSVYVSQ
jgi:signal peptidase